MLDEHYMLRQAKFVRNACAHSSNIVNGFAATSGSLATNASVSQALAAAGISKRVRSAKMHNPRLQQIVTLLYLHARFMKEGTTGRNLAKVNLASLKESAAQVVAHLSNNDAVRSSLNFLMTLIDNWFT